MPSRSRLSDWLTWYRNRRKLLTTKKRPEPSMMTPVIQASGRKIALRSIPSILFFTMCLFFGHQPFFYQAVVEFVGQLVMHTVKDVIVLQGVRYLDRLGHAFLLR